jgi:hypothetical protein
MDTTDAVADTLNKKKARRWIFQESEEDKVGD